MGQVSRAVAAAICVLLSLAAPATAATSTRGYVNALRPKIAAELRGLSVPGAIVYVDAPGKGAWTATFGSANLKTGAPMRTDFHMRIGSITKTMTGTVILRLVDQRKLRLDDPIGKYERVPTDASKAVEAL
jgi:D-alanyl-D-alanine carboxypeptidase